MKTWTFRQRRDGAPEPPNLADASGVSPRLASLLWRRNVRDTDEMRLFLSPMLRHLAMPTAWPGVGEAADLLMHGLTTGKRLAVWGDYDVDGVTATALVMQVLRHHGFLVEWHLPDRLAEGYGLNVEHVERLAASGVGMLLTVDCGISDTAAIARARELGMEVVVSDHHLPPATLPPADVLCNPRLGDCPCASLAGVGVAFFLMAEINSRLAALGRPRFDMRQTLDLVALGTLADMVSLEGQNRILVKNGLLKIAEARRPGVAELKVVSGYQPLAFLGAGQVVFSLAPRLNAAGRMAHATLALDLLCCDDHNRAAELARQLNDHNTERRRQEEQIVEEARVQAEACLADPALVLAGADWNQGVIGIVASRMVERYNKPAVILCADGETLKGSGRSVPSFDLHQGLSRCADLLVGYGGHRMAAGVRMEPSRLKEFRERFLSVARAELGDTPAPSSLTLDGELNFAAASDFTFLKELEMLQPFGVGNPEPVFASPPLTVLGRKLFGSQRDHVDLELQDESCGTILHAKAWRQAGVLPSSMTGKRLRLAYSPSIDMYNGIANVDIKIRDIELL
ncbi:MAG: single-stranded-DNA-specific exonuclease RecJ [Desulfovibrionaceae bacterium]|nr:single-stranded-DNA-specific exonuclease RecJ [Desulfovibrionaceae bacterium]